MLEKFIYTNQCFFFYITIQYQPQDNLHRKLAEETPFGIEMVNIQHLWSLDTTYEHVKICVVDTGYDLGHPDLPSNNVTGWDPTTGSYADGLWYVDGHSHGTHCAGTIGAIGGNDGKST